MQFGKAIGTACSTFAITNIDDLFVLVTFFAEAASGKNTLLKIAIGQYAGFTVIIAISMIGYGAALVLPAEPIGFLGLLPMLLGVWKLLGIVSRYGEKEVNGEVEEEGEDTSISRSTAFKAIGSVALITMMNGGDNIGTYAPLFSQAKGAEIAVYIVVYYIFLGVWLLVAYLVMQQRHILALAEKYASYVIPFLYIGLGIFIVVNSECYPWAIDKIDGDISLHPGKVAMGVSTAGLLCICIALMIWARLRSRAANRQSGRADANLSATLNSQGDGGEDGILAKDENASGVEVGYHDALGAHDSNNSDNRIPEPKKVDAGATETECEGVR